MEPAPLISLKLAIVGNVDSGKTTLVGVLSKGAPDDGRGSARVKVFNYPHEALNGRTSSIAQEIIGFDSNGEQVLPDRYNPNKNKYWPEVVKKSSKIVNLIDLCGHEKYLKTTLFGLVGLEPDYVILIIGANMGVSKMTKEHLGITLCLKIPFFIVLTKVDICPENIYKENLENLMKLLRSNLVNRVPILIKNKEESIKCAETILSDRICPIFPVSSVTSLGVPNLLHFLGLLKNRIDLQSTQSKPFQYDITENFMIPGIGIVLSGNVKTGSAKVKQNAYLGPDKNKAYKLVTIKSIHSNRVPVEVAHAGQPACLAIKPSKANETLTRDELRKGMVLIDPVLKVEPTRNFEAEVVILHHSTTIKEGYQCVMHCGIIRQSIEIWEIDTKEKILRTGDKGLTKMRFLFNPEFLTKGQVLILREGRTKILGVITNILADNEQHAHSENKTKNTEAKEKNNLETKEEKEKPENKEEETKLNEKNYDNSSPNKNHGEKHIEKKEKETNMKEKVNEHEKIPQKKNKKDKTEPVKMNEEEKK